jgi:putative tricarboxylic transport membrane protein
MALAKGGSFGGSIPAILFNMPGTPQATATCIDGYEMTKRGKGGKALKTALYSSTIGDLVSDIVLLLVAAPLAAIALRIGPPEYAMVVLFSLVIIATATGKHPIRGMISVGLGLLLGTVGRDTFAYTERFTFGLLPLEDGISLIPLLLGLLVLSEVFVQLRARAPVLQTEDVKETAEKLDNSRFTLTDFRRCIKTILRSAVIGTGIGAAPGIGATVGAFLSYDIARRTSRHPEEFGRGSIEGVAAPEAGNSAVQGANLIPLVTLGIPGSVVAALILGAFMIHGMTPGPFLMQQQGPLLYALFITLIIANFFLLGIGHLFIRLAVRVQQLPRATLLPLILVFCTIGAYAVSRSLFDVQLLFVFGIIGYVLRQVGVPLIPLVIAFFLGPMLETSIRRSLLISGGDLSIFVTRPIALAFVVLTAISLMLLLYRAWQGKRSGSR